MFFFDPFAGGCNVSFAAEEMGFEVISSDLFVQAFPGVILQDYREVKFPKGSIAWLSPPCRDFSTANPRALFQDSVLFQNPTLSQVDTIFIENVRGYRVHDKLLEEFAVVNGYQYHRSVVNFADYGAVQSRARFLACLSRWSDIVQRFRDIPQKINRENVNRAWFTIEALADPYSDSEVPEGFYRRHTARGVDRLYKQGDTLPTLTRSNLARPWALVGHKWRVSTENLVDIEGFRWAHRSILDKRELVQSVLGDGVPFYAAQHILQSVLG